MSKLYQQSHYKPRTTQKVTFSGTSAATTNAIGAHITVVRLVATEPCYVAFGGAPVATSSSIYLPADRPEYFTVNSGDKVAALQVGSGGVLDVTEMTQ